MTKRLLVEGLDWGIQDKDLLGAFEPFGEIIEAKIATDWETGRSRGFGHVTFRTSSDAEVARRALDGQKLADKVLRVMIAPDQVPPARTIYRNADFGVPGARTGRTPTYRSADFHGSGQPAPPAPKKIYRSIDFEPLPGEEEPPLPSAPDTAEEPEHTGPMRGHRPRPEDALDDEEVANRARYGGWTEGTGSGEDPFG